MAKTKRKIDPDSILRKIHELTVGRISEIDAELSSGPDPFRFQVLHRSRRKLVIGCVYRVELIADRVLTSAEKKAFQRVVANLESEKLVIVEGVRGSRIRLSKKGRKHLSELATK